MCCSEGNDISIEKEMLDELNSYLSSKDLKEEESDNNVSLESFFED